MITFSLTFGHYGMYVAYAVVVLSRSCGRWPTEIRSISPFLSPSLLAPN